MIQCQWELLSINCDVLFGFTESFIQSIVTFDDLSNNPAILSDPKLVIRINDRYYVVYYHFS